MNGQMYQICSIAAACKNALRSGDMIEYTREKYVNILMFSFLPEKRFFLPKIFTAPDVSEWFEHMKSKGLQDIKFLCPINVKERNTLGFSNTTESRIMCFFEKGAVTYFTADWKLDNKNKQWTVLYSEHEWKDPPSEKPRFENNTETFKQVLSEIEDLALRIECDDFAGIFKNAENILEGSGEYPDEKYGLTLPQLPGNNLRIFEAASCADVFGAMGSWNDSPPYMAHEKGLDREYERLSDDLLKNIRLALLYALNEW